MWNLPGNYSSIQLADIDGDGQDELLGYGPFGIEVWHWDPAGEAWLQMPAGTPKFGPTDMLMTADVNGDGQAEILQVTNAQSATQSVTVAVWHYDVAAQVWQYQPALNLSLPVSTDINNKILSPMIQFQDFKNSGRKDLVYLFGLGNGEGELVDGQIFQVKPDKSGWVNVGTLPYTTLPASTPGGPFKIADVTNSSYGVAGDGLPDIVLKTPTGFQVWAQTASSNGNVTFASGKFSVLPGNAAPQGNFGFVSDPVNKVQDIVAVPSGAYLIAFSYNPQLLIPQGNSIPGGMGPLGIFAFINSSLFTAVTGLNASNPSAASVLLLGADGLDEYGVNGIYGLTKISATPFFGGTRFASDPSYYNTLQSGTVSYGGALQPIIVGRDANGIHTLIRSTNVCQTGVAGFTLPQAKYFPKFSGATAAAYGYISNKLVTGNFNIRSIYSNDYASLPSYEATLAALQYPASTPNLQFKQADFDTVKAQLNQELLAGGNVVSYFAASNSEIENLFDGEVAALPAIVNALNLPSDVSLQTQNPAGYIFSQIFTQLLSTIFFGISGIPGEEGPQGTGSFTGQGLDEAAAQGHFGISTELFNEAAIGLSAIGTVISDVQSFSSTSNTGNLTGQTLVVENQVLNWRTAAATQNALAQSLALQNFDVMTAISDQIGNGTLAVSSVAGDQALNATLTQFQISTWQALAPQSWVIDAFYNGAEGLADTYISKDYPGKYEIANPANGSDFHTVLLYVGLAGTTQSQVFESGYELPAPAAAIQQLLNLGVNINDVLAQRDGWQNIPNGSGNCFDGTNSCVIPADPIVAPTQPVFGAPATLTVVSGGEETAQVYTCNGQSATILQQSTPIYSVFPEPIQVQVQDKNGYGVPNATVQVKGNGGLNPTTINALTDVNGYASISLVANGLVQSTYRASLSVTSPAYDTSFPACSVNAAYELENTPAPQGGTVPAGIQLVANHNTQGGPATARKDQIMLDDKSGSSTALTLNSLTLQANGSTCKPTLTTPLPLTMSGPDSSDAFTANLTFNESSCKGMIPGLTLTLNATSTITLTDGTSYTVPATATITNFKP